MNNEYLQKLVDALDRNTQAIDERNRARPVNEEANRRFFHTLQYSSKSLQADAQVFTGGACRIFNVFGVNTQIQDLYLQIHDSNKVPVNGAVPTIAFSAFGGANFARDLSMIPWRFQNGIYVCGSSTLATLTLAGNVLLFHVQYLHEGAS